MSNELEILQINNSMLLNLNQSVVSLQTVNLEMMGLLSKLRTLQNFGFSIFTVSTLLLFFSIRSKAICGLGRKAQLLLTSLFLLFGVKELIWLDFNSLFVFVNSLGGLDSLSIGKHYFLVYLIGILCLSVALIGSGNLFLYSTNFKNSGSHPDSRI